MVERLKDAIEKARRSRSQSGGPISAGAAEAPADAVRDTGIWGQFDELRIDIDHMESSRIIAFAREDPAHVRFDVLRTTLLRQLRQNSWRQVAVTSPTKGCGKTVISTNLALSLSHNQGCRTVLIDLDLRAPQVAAYLGERRPRDLKGYLAGRVAPEDYFLRIGNNLALGLNSERIREASETLQAPSTAETISAMLDRLNPDVVIYDISPLFAGDDAIAFLSSVDCAILVAAAGMTRASEIEECEMQLSGVTELLGVVLNKCDAAQSSQYYGYAYE